MCIRDSAAADPEGADAPEPARAQGAAADRRAGGHPEPVPAVSYTHLTLPTSDLV